MRNSYLAYLVPRQRLVSVRELRGSKNRAAVDAGECCWRQPASAPQSVSPLRVRCYLLLSCAIRGCLRLGGFLLGKENRSALAVSPFIKQEGNHEPFSHSDVRWGNYRSGGINVSVGISLPGAQPKRSNWHRLRHHTGKGAVNLVAPVHTPRRWDWLHNRMVPAVLEQLHIVFA
jgi:hypothetical protein